MLVEESVLNTSTSDISPTTFTVSATCARAIVTLMRSVWPTRRVRPVCVAVAKPESWALMA